MYILTDCAPSFGPISILDVSLRRKVSLWLTLIAQNIEYDEMTGWCTSRESHVHVYRCENVSTVRIFTIRERVSSVWHVRCIFCTLSNVFGHKIHILRTAKTFMCRVDDARKLQKQSNSTFGRRCRVGYLSLPKSRHDIAPNSRF